MWQRSLRVTRSSRVNNDHLATRMFTSEDFLCQALWCFIRLWTDLIILNDFLVMPSIKDFITGNWTVTPLTLMIFWWCLLSKILSLALLTLRSNGAGANTHDAVRSYPCHDHDEVQLLTLLAEKIIRPQEHETFVPLDGEHSSGLAPRLEIKGCGNLWHVYGWPIITAATGRGLW